MSGLDNIVWRVAFGILGFLALGVGCNVLFSRNAFKREKLHPIAKKLIAFGLVAIGGFVSFTCFRGVLGDVNQWIHGDTAKILSYMPYWAFFAFCGTVVPAMYLRERLSRGRPYLVLLLAISTYLCVFCELSVVWWWIEFPSIEEFFNHGKVWMLFLPYPYVAVALAISIFAPEARRFCGVIRCPRWAFWVALAILSFVTNYLALLMGGYLCRHVNFSFN